MDPKKFKKRALEMYAKGKSINDIAIALGSSDAEILELLPAKERRKIMGATPKATATQAYPSSADGGPVYAYLHFALPERGDVGLGGDEAPAQSSYGSRDWCEHCGSSAGCSCRARLGLPARPVRVSVPRGDRNTGL